MFEEFYGLKTKPFGRTPDPKFLFLSRAHSEALARLQYGVEEREIMLLTGEAGCGKTTLTRALIDSFDEKQKVVLILNPRLTSMELLRTVAKRLGSQGADSSKSDMLDSIYSTLYEDYKSGKTPVIIIDEAHLIPYRETYEEIRLLTNFQLDNTNLLSLIFVGQTELRQKLKLSSLAALRQRIGLFYHIGPINLEDTREYLQFRLKAGGCEEPLFGDDAIRLIHKYSKGIPRVINTIATMALLEGLSREKKIIDTAIIESALKEVGLNGYR